MADINYVSKFNVYNSETGAPEEVEIEASKVTDTKEIEFGAGFNVDDTTDPDKIKITANFIPADTDLVGVVVTEQAPTTVAAKTLYLLVE